MMVAIFIGCALGSYLIGSIPTGFWLGYARGIDIRKVGSGNIGATNTMRALGKPTGFLVLFIDMAKGYVPVFAAAPFFPEVSREALQIVCCVSVIAGHNWTCFLKFKGGKGVATTAGALLAFLPYPILCAIGVWVIIFAVSRYVSLASICAAVALPVAAGLITHDALLTGFAALLGGLTIWKHKSNIQRLRAGTENRVGRARPPGAPTSVSTNDGAPGGRALP